MEDGDDSEREPKAAKTSDPVLKIMGARIRAVRSEKKRGLTETADAAGMPKGFLWRTEDGQQNLSIKTLARIAVALGATMADLLKGVPATAPPPAGPGPGNAAAGDHDAGTTSAKPERPASRSTRPRPRP